MKYWRTSVLPALLLMSLIWPGFSAVAAQSMTLAQCVAVALEDNPTLEASRLEIQAAEANRKSARGVFLPSATTEYGMNRVHSRSAKGLTDDDALNQDGLNFSVRLSQVLYSGFRNFNSYQRAKIRKSLLTAELELRRMEVRYDIETTFYRLLKAKQDVVVARESVLRLKESLKAAEALFRREQIPYVDVLQAKVEVAGAIERLGVAGNDVNRERASLFTLMNKEESPDISFIGAVDPDLSDPPAFEVNRQIAFENRPDIKSLECQLQIAQKDAAIAKGQYLPVVRLDVGYYDQDRDFENDVYDRRNRYWSAGVSASWSLFDGGRAFYESQEHEIMSNRIKSLILDTKNSISKEIRCALYAMTEAKQRVKVSVEALGAANEYYAGEEKRLTAGLSTIPNLLDAHVQLIQAQRNNARAILDYRLAQSDLKLMTGSSDF
ncbi:TolC family protein [Desulfobacter curvatus]|uniref:TolC family protein n=1 Tax=Desulfobacter curvatus TaxID=2290 RepID=UPI000527DB03|nr:TolC family protein [Desulfobacter curvatus]